MSNSIWKTPDQKPERNEDILVEYTSTNSQPYYIVDSYLNKLLRPKRWAYLTDIIAQADKAERLQKAVDLIANMEQRLCIDDPVDILDDVLKIAKDEIKQMIKENQ